MIEISKCSGTDCPQRETCWRYLAPAADLVQSWLMIRWDAERGECEYYLPLVSEREEP